MEEAHVEGSSDPPRPRVMAAWPQGHVVSVKRGTRGPDMDLRDYPFRGADIAWWKGRPVPAILTRTPPIDS